MAFVFCRQFHYSYSFPFLELPCYLLKGWQKLFGSIITCIWIFIIQEMCNPQHFLLTGGLPFYPPSFAFLLDSYRKILGVMKKFSIFYSCYYLFSKLYKFMYMHICISFPSGDLIYICSKPCETGI